MSLRVLIIGGYGIFGPIVHYRGSLTPTDSKVAARGEAYAYRDDSSVPAFADSRPIFVFDGVCVLCSSAARWLLRHDKKDVFRYLPAQSALGQALYAHAGLAMNDTFLLIRNGHIYSKSAACLQIVAALGGRWRVLQCFFLVPRFLRDAVYSLVARNRYVWFGKTEYCEKLPEKLKEKML